MKKAGFILCAFFTVAFAFGGMAVTSAAEEVSGVVYEDINRNGMFDDWEPGVPAVPVSNGKEVVLTNGDGEYVLPAYDEMTVFVTKPNGYQFPVNENNIPQFFYIHQPKGSPAEIQEFKGLDSTGPLPEKINFPLYKHIEESSKFRAVIFGDTQTYSESEINYLRDTIVEELSDHDTISFAMTMGDNIGDKISLYPQYLSVMKNIGLPIYYVAGNHDVNYDANDDAHSLDTYKREVGPAYYSFNYGKVHFVVLDDVVYPSPKFTDKKLYHGEINGHQMEWLTNDLKYVPEDYLIVLNMHIPIVCYIDREADRHQVCNREALYALLKGRHVLSLAGHTHTIEHYQANEQLEEWGQATPFPQIIIGAVCGSWWSGDLDEDGIPVSYQRGGAPKGYMVFDFDNETYVEHYKAIGKPLDEQINVSLWTASFEKWLQQLYSWGNEDPKTRTEQPPVTLNDLVDPNAVSQEELQTGLLIANVWDGTTDSVVTCQIDDREPVTMAKNTNIGDPHVLRLEAFVYRYVTGFSMYRDRQYGPAAPQPLPVGLFTNDSYHIWSCKLPTDLELGVHRAKVRATNAFGDTFEEVQTFQVTGGRLAFEIK